MLASSDTGPPKNKYMKQIENTLEVNNDIPLEKKQPYLEYDL